MGDLGSEPPTTEKSASIFLQIVEHPDGTVTRPFVPLIPVTDGDGPLIPVTDGNRDAVAVRSRDVLLGPFKISLRIYLPELHSSPSEKLPLVLFFHGGGFVLFRPASAPYHFSCEHMARSLSAIVLSLDYRLAPEHRLPAAYDDAVESILWVRSQAAADPSERDPWLAEHADFGRFFIMGSSSGANMAFHSALRVSDLDLQPLQIAGIVLNQPYLGGEERTPSEEASEEDAILPLRANDMLWRLALPLGADRDHEYCNPVSAMAAEKISKMPARCLVKGRRGDPLIDRQRQLLHVMEAAGLRVVGQLEDEGFHAIELLVPSAAEALFTDVSEFFNA
ncbi:hypothetical protein HPP92_005014 [Vanilla planifolia]|uniref:Alpha/beta hydrolase fold-3 domain-containing protein n=1 Tax=Vanilla planifolia TaxID=51239 RepID=A0A835VEH3_VANPL|nr:hypothetical protein HPP92_005014 [Vanilla planifolia]